MGPHGYQPGCWGTSRAHGELKSPRAAPSPTPSLGWLGGAVHLRVVSAPSSQLLRCRTLSCGCGATPLLSTSFFWLLHSEFKWPCLCSLGCLRRASARCGADESQVVAWIRCFCCSSLHSEFKWPCLCSLGCLHRASAWCGADESQVAAWFGAFVAAFFFGWVVAAPCASGLACCLCLLGRPFCGFPRVALCSALGA